MIVNTHRNEISTMNNTIIVLCLFNSYWSHYCITRRHINHSSDQTFIVGSLQRDIEGIHQRDSSNSSQIGPPIEGRPAWTCSGVPSAAPSITAIGTGHLADGCLATHTPTHPPSNCHRLCVVHRRAGGGHPPNTQHPSAAQSPVAVHHVGRIFSPPAPAMDFDFKFNAAEGTAPAPGTTFRLRIPEIRPGLGGREGRPADTWRVHQPVYYATDI